tara:strand:+ start:1778 stop:2104 length:327 start_codon:yes stop_codon:yes gene_type:complete
MNYFKKYYYSNDFIRYFGVTDQMYTIKEVKQLILTKFRKFNNNNVYVKKKDLLFLGLENMGEFYSKFGIKIRVSLLLTIIVDKFKISEVPPKGLYYHYYDKPLENNKL